MDGEPIDLLHEYGGRLVRRWHHKGVGPWDEAHAYLRELADGRWAADRTGVPGGTARAYPDEQSALDGVREMMANRPTGWVELEPEAPPIWYGSPGEHRRRERPERDQHRERR